MSATETLSFAGELNLPESPEMLTFDQALEFCDVKKNTFRGWVRDRRVVRANPRRGRFALFLKSDLLPFAGGIWRDIPRATLRDKILASGMRKCTGTCGRTLPLESFHKKSDGTAGRYSRCYACQKIADLPRMDIVRKQQAASARRFRARHGDRCNVYSREMKRMERAVLDGKFSPITGKHGFSIVIVSRPNCLTGTFTDDSRRFRAARLDYPLDTGEVAIAHFLPIRERKSIRWEVVAPPLGSASPLCTANDAARLLHLLQSWETKNTASLQNMCPSDKTTKVEKPNVAKRDSRGAASGCSIVEMTMAEFLIASQFVGESRL